MDKDIAAITTEMFGLLEPRSPEERQRIVKAVFALLGDELPNRTRDSGKADGDGFSQSPIMGPRATSWARNHKLSQTDMERMFYFHDGKVDIHVNEVPGKSKREQTENCYLLVGLRVFLENDSSSFTDAEALALCKHTQAYDKNNHRKFRTSLGNLVNGSSGSGFELAGPGLKRVGELIAEMGKSEA